MSYKARDLDLRTPHVAGAGEDAGAGWSLPLETGRDVPIPVDPTVLACCNAAYEAARFHGAREVRLEHLLYAITRIDAARDVLEQLGVRTQHLRRDAGGAIADEASAIGGSKGPRSSTELESVLRRAAGRAGQSGIPVSVHDVLRALLSGGRDAPAVSLLLRSANDAPQLERWASEPPSQWPAYAATLQPTVAQELLGRLETVEIAMRSIAAEVAADRKAMLDLMGEIQHELRTARQASIAAQPAIVLDKIEDVGRSVTGLTERFEAIRTIAPADTVAVRLTALESKVSEQPAAIADAVAYMLTERQNGGDETLELIAEDGARGPGGVLSRLAELDTAVRAQTERVEDAGKAHERDLNEIFEALVKLGTNQQTLASNLDAWRLDNSGDVSIVSNRLENMERTLQEALTPPTVRIIEESSRFTPEELENSTGFKRWLYGTGRVLPSSWREDMSALRESLRTQRRIEKS